jgi:ketosteroid isomerase-like protein
MKGLAILVSVICLAFMLLAACAPAPEPEVDLSAEEEELRKFIEEVVATYENRDGRAMARMCDETFMNLGRILTGQENKEEFWENFLGSLENTQINLLEEIGLEFVTPEVAILLARIELTNRPPNADGNPQARPEYYSANVYVKRDGRWLRKGAFLRPITAALPSE